jgi:hypothetical protein
MLRGGIEMSVDDRGTHQPEGFERAERARRRPPGRHRRGTAGMSTALEEGEPLFTYEVDLDVPLGRSQAAPLPAREPADPPPTLTYDPASPGLVTPEVRLESVLRPMIEEVLVLPEEPSAATLPATSLPTPVVAAPAPVVSAPAEPVAVATAEAPAPAEPRPGLVASFRRWWRDEANARAAQKRAFATAEAIMRAQAAQDPENPLPKSPTAESYAQAIRGVMTLTDERFQNLALRSDRLEDELRALARATHELRGLLSLGGLEGVGPAAASAIGTLEQRFDTLLVRLAEEISSRADESDRRLAQQVALQSAELATLLESAVERIRAAIPEAFGVVRAQIPQEMARVRETIPAEFQRVRDAIPGELERIRADHRYELEQLRATIPSGFEQIRATIPTELAKIVPDQVERVREANADEFERLRSMLPEELEKVRLSIPTEVDRVRATIPEALEKVRGDIAQLTVVLHEVIAQMATITSAASGQGERSEPR